MSSSFLSNQSSANSQIQDFSSIVASFGSSNNDSSEDDQDSYEEQEELIASEYNENEDDPLGVKKLSLSFDYLMYKINEKIKALAEQTETSVNNRKTQIDQQLTDVDGSIESLKKIITICEELDMEFTKVEQLSYIVGDFKQRIKDLDHYFQNE